jgi:hypothetical protein
LPTGPLNRKALLTYINEQAKKTPDKPELVPHVPGTIRGTKWIAPKQPSIMEGYGFEDDIELDIEFDEETEAAFKEAESHDIIDMAGINISSAGFIVNKTENPSSPYPRALYWVYYIGSNLG